MTKDATQKAPPALPEAIRQAAAKGLKGGCYVLEKDEVILNPKHNAELDEAVKADLAEAVKKVTTTKAKGNS